MYLRGHPIIASTIAVRVCSVAITGWNGMGPSRPESLFPRLVSRSNQNPPDPEKSIFALYAEPRHTSDSSGRQGMRLIPLAPEPYPLPSLLHSAATLPHLSLPLDLPPSRTSLSPAPPAPLQRRLPSPSRHLSPVMARIRGLAAT